MKTFENAEKWSKSDCWLAYFDILGSLGIAYFAFKEGREAFDLSKSGELKCMCESHDEE